MIGIAGEFPLPPVIEGTGNAFNAAAISKAVMAVLKKFEVPLGKIRFYMRADVRAVFEFLRAIPRGHPKLADKVRDT